MTKFQIYLGNFVMLWIGHFPRKKGMNDQNPKVLKNISSYKIRFKTNSSKTSTNTRGRGQGHLEKVQT